MSESRNSTFNKLTAGAVCNLSALIGTAGLALNGIITEGVGMLLLVAIIVAVRFFTVIAVGIFAYITAGIIAYIRIFNFIFIFTRYKAENQRKGKQQYN